MCKSGETIEISIDHKPESLPGECKRIVKAGGEIINGRVNGSPGMSRAIGDFEFKNKIPKHKSTAKWFLNNHIVTSFPDISVIDLTNEIEFLVIASDGIWDCNSSNEVI